MNLRYISLKNHLAKFKQSCMDTTLGHYEADICFKVNVSHIRLGLGLNLLVFVCTVSNELLDGFKLNLTG